MRRRHCLFQPEPHIRLAVDPAQPPTIRQIVRTEPEVCFRAEFPKTYVAPAHSSSRPRTHAAHARPKATMLRYSPQSEVHRWQLHPIVVGTYLKPDDDPHRCPSIAGVRGM